MVVFVVVVVLGYGKFEWMTLELKTTVGNAGMLVINCFVGRLGSRLVGCISGWSIT